MIKNRKMCWGRKGVKEQGSPVLLVSGCHQKARNSRRDLREGSESEHQVSLLIING